MSFQNKLTFNTAAFYAGLIIKIILGTFLASGFLTDLFIPFVDYFVESGFSNPYERFVGVGDKAHFPYPVLMLYIMALPKTLLGWIAPENIFFSLFLYRLPLLIADLSIFFIINSWLREKFRRRLILFYWLSPVLIYISFIHGQLDVIPIALLFGSLYYLFKERFFLSSLLFGLSLATKTNVLLVYPFFFLFLLSKNVNLKNLFFFTLISIGSFFVINQPYIFNSSFIEMVFQNKEQSKMFNAFVQLNNLSVYMIPASLLILFVRGVLLRTYNKDIFIMFLGFNFSIILLFIPPMQGWYFWLIPFLSYFYIKESGRSPFIFFGLQALYLLYFLFSENSDYFQVFQLLSRGLSNSETIYQYLLASGVSADKFSSIIFTALQTTLLINCFWIYQKGLESYSKHKITSSPFLVGIGGNSGVGKTTISDALSSIFSPSNTTVLRGDDMHKWQRGHEKWNELTHLDPKANNLHKEMDFLKKLKSGMKISRRLYDHSTGQFTEEQLLEPNNIVIFEGLHPFYLSSQRALYDLKIFLKPSIELMYHWKIIRDMECRSYSKEVILASIRSRESDSKKYIETQTDKADIVIEALPVEKIQEIGDMVEQIHVFYNLLLSNSVYIEPVVDALQTVETLDISHHYTEEDHQLVVLKGTCSVEDIKHIAKEHVGSLEDLGVNAPNWPDGLLGVLLLLLTYYIFEKAEYDR